MVRQPPIAWRRRSRRIYTRILRTWSYCVRSLNEPVVFQRRVDKTPSPHNLFHLLVASVAQLVEQLTLNQLVPGSSPGRGTTSKKTERGSPFLTNPKFLARCASPT